MKRKDFDGKDEESNEFKDEQSDAKKLKLENVNSDKLQELDIRFKKALKEPDFDLAESIIAEGADVNFRGTNGLTPLEFVIDYFKDEEEFDPKFDVYGEQFKIIEFLIAKGADVNNIGSKGFAPLEFVIEYLKDFNQICRIIDLLIKKGADVNFVGNKGLTPLEFLKQKDLGADHEAILMLRLIEGRARYDQAIIDRLLLLWFSQEQEDEEEAKGILYALERGANPNQLHPGSKDSLLMNACLNRMEAVVKILLEKGASVNYVNPRTGENALLTAVKPMQHSYSRKKEMDNIIKLLLDYGANVNYVNPITGDTPIKVAVYAPWGLPIRTFPRSGKFEPSEDSSKYYISVEGIKALIEHGAKYDQNDIDALLFYAFQNSFKKNNYNQELILFAIDKGARLDQIEQKIAKPLLVYAIEHGHKFAIELGCKAILTKLTEKQNVKTQVLEQIVSSFLITKQQDSFSIDTELLKQALEELVWKGYSFNNIDKNTKKTTLETLVIENIYYTIDSKNFIIKKSRYTATELTSLIDILVELGANINYINPESRISLLIQAISNNDVEITKVLLKNGALVNIQSPKIGMDALTFACCLGYGEMVDLLISHGANVNGINSLTKITPLIYAAGAMKFKNIQTKHNFTENNYESEPEKYAVSVTQSLLKSHKVDLNMLFDRTSDQVTTTQTQLDLALKYANSVGFREVNRTIQIYRAFADLINSKKDNSEMLKLICSGNEQEAKFIKELTYSYFTNIVKTLKIDKAKIIVAKLQIDKGLIKAEGEVLIKFDKNVHNYNTALQDALKEFEQFIALKNTDLEILETHILYTYYDEDFIKKIMDKKLKNDSTKLPSGKEEIDEELKEEGVLGINENYIIGSGDLFKKLLNKIVLGAMPEPEILNPLLLSKEHSSQFIYFFNQYKNFLPRIFQEKGINLIKIIQSAKSNPFQNMFLTHASNNNYLAEKVSELKEEVTSLKTKLINSEAQNKAYKAQNSKLEAIVNSITKLLCANGLVGAEDLLKQMTNPDEQMAAENNLAGADYACENHNAEPNLSGQLEPHNCPGLGETFPH
ncbi:MAG: serine/threonine-protein phosphatase 6 regulatory ankyrin repeat subunit B-like isoform [Rickettsiaceae bacterium]|jgi:ankyrin repeat protein|nr:serine/threonine-protein phosphatase 6 regulatory ankyrin repeat subunit B-like isoform [Rickettsiaceae bacterium]